MKKSTAVYLILAVLFLCFLNACKPKNATEQVIHIMEVDPGFSTYIEEYTSGIIPVNSSFRVKLTAEVAPSIENIKEPIEMAEMFSIDPSVKGECTDSEGIFTFKPAENLKEGTEYIITFFLKTVMEVPAKFEKLKFNAFTLKRNISVSVIGLKSNSSDQPNLYSIQGKILTSVPLDEQQVEWRQ